MTPLRQPRSPDPAPPARRRAAQDPANDNARPPREVVKLAAAWALIGAVVVLGIWAAG